MGGAGGTLVECSTAEFLDDIEGKPCDDERARCDIGRECCCGECEAELECSCDDGAWSCYHTDFCAFVDTCGGAGGESGHAGQSR
jgi:hypothetical protein